MADQITCFNEQIAKIVEDMAYTMYHSNGIGLAATQVDIHKRIIVIDISEERNNLMVLINPEIVTFSDTKELSEEGCLSVFDTYEKVQRFCSITCKAYDQYGVAKTIDAYGLLSRCIQHEIDHLNGRIFIDYLSSLKRDRISSRIKKLNKLKK
ncbi:peptide deformylase [Candidatus Kinetoplastibacterium crithidii (ex Angomonas deanei ATCC 30255)]|nr:peptide deformylase [Candidatus Kinetoplastibacterium crithidii (ex Angomonas deanei ATCC 30255)]